MDNYLNENLEEKYRHLFDIITNESFLKQKVIGGEVPFFISTYNPENEFKVQKYIVNLKSKLENNGLAILNINLYDLSLQILKNREVFEKVVSKENSMSKDKFLKTLQSLLDVETKVIPEISNLLMSSSYDVLFITGVGLVYPYIRSHNVLNNLQRISKTLPSIMFFPGEYDGTYLNLFGELKDDNYYRAFNIDVIKLKKEN